jgi:hypothetical protein
VFTYVIKSVFDALAFFFSYDQKGISTVQLEVLPLDKYVCGIQSDILQQAAFVAAQTPGQGLRRQVAPFPPPLSLSYQTHSPDPWTRPCFRFFKFSPFFFHYFNHTVQTPGQVLLCQVMIP